MRKHKKRSVSRFRYWTALLYTENLKDSWKSLISEILPCPYCYCVHAPEEEDLKEHVHLMLMFKNPVTEKSVKGLLSALDFDKDKPACHAHLENILNAHGMYEYLIHADDESRLAGKILYSSEDRILGNGFDIEDFDYETKRANKNKRFMWLLDSIVEHEELVDMKALYLFLKSHRASEFDRYVSIIKKNILLISKLLDSNKGGAVRKVSTVREIVGYRELHENAPNLNETIKDRELVGEA